MKKVLKTILAVIIAATVLVFCACSNDDDNNSSKQDPQGGGKNSAASKLPESSGENPFVGKKWIFSASEDENFGYGYLKFSNTTVEFKDPIDWSSAEIYDYSFDTTKQLIYLSRKTFTGWNRYFDGNKSFSSVDEYINEMRTAYQQNGIKWTPDTEAYYTDEASAYFSELKVKKYEISDSTLTLTEYFIGEIPLDTETEGESVRIKGCLRLNSLMSYPVFSDGEFHGNAYSSENYDEYTKIGIIKGTYTTSEPGIGSWYVNLKFSSIPESEKSLKLSTEYTISYTWKPALAPITYTLEK